MHTVPIKFTIPMLCLFAESFDLFFQKEHYLNDFKSLWRIGDKIKDYI